MITSKVLLSIHSQRGRGRLEPCWPLAFSDTATGESYEDLPGMWALWEAVGDLDEFCLCLFDSGELSGASPDAGGWSGLWVYEVEYKDPGHPDDDQEPNTPEFWEHLHGGDFRRPTPEELAQVNGSADGPWKVVL